MPATQRMVLSIVEGHVPSDQWDALQQSFQASVERGLPPQIQQMYLVQDVTDQFRWRCISLWPSMEALDKYRHSVTTPGAQLMFFAVGVDPSVSLSNVVIAGN